jgi:6-phosphogluconolactonase
MKRILYNAVDELIEDGVELLGGALTSDDEAPSLVMVTGGRTPRPVYEVLRQRAPSVSEKLHVTLSDERFVSRDDPASNTRQLMPLMDACGISGERAILPRMDYSFARCAFEWDSRLDTFFQAGGSFPLAVLGLGADGHVAGLFSADQIAQGLTGWAQGVDRPDGREGITATARCLLRAERVVFWVVGPDKADAVERLFNAPHSIPAGMIFSPHDNVEVWWADSGL